MHIRYVFLYTYIYMCVFLCIYILDMCFLYTYTLHMFIPNSNIVKFWTNVNKHFSYIRTVLDIKCLLFIYITQYDIF